MSKTFESIGNCLELSVGKVDNESLVGVELRHTNGRWVGIASLAPSDAPALALAILEAAGYDDMADDANLADVHAFNAMHKLQESVDTQERATAEAAKEQAELEAEALDFYEAATDSTGTKFEFLSNSTQQVWMKVARKAREMRKS